MFIYFTFILCCIAGTYNAPETISIPNDFSVLTINTQLTKDIVKETNCLNIEHKDIYATAFLFESTEQKGVMISTQNNVEIFLENLKDNKCYVTASNNVIKIETNVDYKLVLYSKTYSSDQITFGISYIEEIKQNTNVTTYPYMKYVTVTHSITSVEDLCSENDKNKDKQIIYGYQFKIKSEKDVQLEINTCSYSNALIALHVVDPKNEQCIVSSDAFSTADLKCAGGLGAKTTIDIHPSMELELYAGFITESLDDRSFILNIVEVATIDPEPESWEIWVYSSIVVGVMLIVTIIILAVAIPVHIRGKKNKRRSNIDEENEKILN